jgi:cytochrome oxidase Cu insertion factor (SCO1/SenC/PrrC family)
MNLKPDQLQPLEGNLMKRFLSLVFVIVALVSTTSAQIQKVEKAVAVGDSAPDFTLEDHRGGKVTLSESKGKSPVVLVFYRGYW